MQKPSSIGVGMIGYSIGRVHSVAWRNAPQFFPINVPPKLVAVCGRNDEATKSFAGQYGFEKTYRDWKDLVDYPAVSVLDDCAPPSLHKDPCVRAAEKGKAVLCEKPLARSADEAYETYYAVSRTGQVHMTGFNKRFVPAVIYARELVREGRLGRINHVVATYYNVESGEGFGRPDIPLLWMFRKEVAGHGAIADIGSHVVDLMRFVVGEISAVCGATATFVERRPLPEDASKKASVDVDDIAIGCLRFSSGAIGTLNVTWSPVAARDYATIEVYGSVGSLRFTFDRPNELELYLNDEGDVKSRGFRTVYCNSRYHPLAKNFWPDQGSSYGFEQSFVSEIAHFISCVQEGRSVEPLGASFYDGYVTCLINDELVASGKDGIWHSISRKPR